MKNLYLLTLTMCMVLLAHAQPQKFNYQGIARTSAGVPLANQNLGLRLSILNNSATGTAVYSESHSVTTNAYGLYNVAVGAGTIISGNFSTINWGTGDKYMKVEIDPAGGTSYTDLAATQLLSVPFALYAATGGSGPAGPAGPVGPMGPAGPAGATGAMGPAGATGATGAAGATGATGAAGAAGAPGSDGRTILNGTGVPAAGLGSNGDFYYRTSNNTIYGPKTAGSWGAATNLVGPAGSTGAAGATGATGPQGPQGVAGPQGPAGTGTISGSTNKLIKFTSATVGGNSIIEDDGTNLGISTPISTTSKLQIKSTGVNNYTIRAIYGTDPGITVSSAAIVGTSNTGTGVIGVTSANLRSGVFGSTSGNGSGVYGSGSGTGNGVYGNANGTGSAIYGNSTGRVQQAHFWLVTLEMQ